MSSIRCRTSTRTRLLALAACAVAAAIGGAGCINVLGLDPPLREACPGCEDADAGSATHVGGSSGSTGSAPVANDAGLQVEASPAPIGIDPPDTGAAPVVPVDSGPPAPTLRCGGGAVRASACVRGSEICCATDADGGGFDFRCIPHSSSCSGVPVTCASQADCSSSTVCCVTNSQQICVTHCPGSLVCDPFASPSECPPDSQCRPFQNPDVPYYACQ